MRNVALCGVRERSRSKSTRKTTPCSRALQLSLQQPLRWCAAVCAPSPFAPLRQHPFPGASQARPADAVASLASQPGPVTLQYASFFSGVGAGWNGATQSAFDAALSAAFAPCGATSASCVPLDFPVALGVTLQGVPLSVWTSTPGLQAQVAAALATDAGLNATSFSPAPDSTPGVAALPQPRVVLGGFVETSAGLYLPFVVAGLGPNPGAAAAAAAALYPAGLVSQSSATQTALRAAGVHCPLAYAPPERGTPGLGASPSIGAVLRVSVSFPNATAGSEGVANCLLDNGELVQQLAAQNVELGPIEARGRSTCSIVFFEVLTMLQTPGRRGAKNALGRAHFHHRRRPRCAVPIRVRRRRHVDNLGRVGRDARRLVGRACSGDGPAMGGGCACPCVGAVLSGTDCGVQQNE